MWSMFRKCRTVKIDFNYLILIYKFYKNLNFLFIFSVKLKGVNSVTVAQAFNSALQNIWPNGVRYDRVLLLLTDGAAHMVKSAAALRTL